jgi:hypothetical protein
MTESDVSVLVYIAIFFWWIFASAAVSGAADKRGYGQGTWFLLSFFLSPVFAVILLNAYPVKVAMDEVRATDNLSITPNQ